MNKLKAHALHVSQVLIPNLNFILIIGTFDAAAEWVKYLLHKLKQFRPYFTCMSIF